MPVGEEPKLTAGPGGGHVLGFGPLETVPGGPVVQVDVQVDQPVVVDRQEFFQVVNAAAPPVIHIAVMKPAQAKTHIDGRDEPLPGQRLLGGRHDPGFQVPLAHDRERSRSGTRHAQPVTQ